MEAMLQRELSVIGCAKWRCGVGSIGRERAGDLAAGSIKSMARIGAGRLAAPFCAAAQPWIDGVSGVALLL